jgi:hypothetical protein
MDMFPRSTFPIAARRRMQVFRPGCLFRMGWYSPFGYRTHDVLLADYDYLADWNDV